MTTPRKRKPSPTDGLVEHFEAQLAQMQQELRDLKKQAETLPESPAPLFKPYSAVVDEVAALKSMTQETIRKTSEGDQRRVHWTRRAKKAGTGILYFLAGVATAVVLL